MSVTQFREGAAKSIVIALLSAGLTIAGTMVKDRVTVERDRATMEAEIAGIGKRVDLHEGRLTYVAETVVTREELKQDLEGIERRLDDIRMMVAAESRQH
jgi:hypothetical protein